MNILVVEDNKLARLNLAGFLRPNQIFFATTFQEALNKISNEQIDLALIDLDLDYPLAGLDILPHALKKNIYSVVLTGHGEDETTLRAYRLGARDYLQKPVDQSSLKLMLDRFHIYYSETRVAELISKNYITTHPETLKELDLLKKIALTDKPILINGPSGTGKSIVANLIREACGIPPEKYVEINCAQFTETLIEAELFGHKKGSFTGANFDKDGLLKKADHGLVFLDEIHSLSKSAQQKLMKAIEEKVFYPVGNNTPVKSNFRVVCATCENLLELIEEKRFRSDFYARIGYLQISLYALKDRPMDILPLIEFYNRKHHRKIVLEEETKKLLLTLDWINNVRDIESLVNFWHINSFGIITPHHIPNSYKVPRREKNGLVISREEMLRVKDKGIKNYLNEVREQIVTYYLNENANNKLKTAKDLKVTDRYIYCTFPENKGDLDENRSS